MNSEVSQQVHYMLGESTWLVSAVVRCRIMQCSYREPKVLNVPEFNCFIRVPLNVL